MSAPRTLIVLAHPNLSGSRANAAMVQAVADLDNVTVHDLYATYPDFRIHVEHEQQLIREHDRVVFQFPFQWYGAPALLKQWMDTVLTMGFAFTFDGSPSEMRGKQVQLAVTVGNNEESYTAEGLNRATVEQLLLPVQRSFEMCQVDHQGAFALHGLMLGTVSDEDLALHTKRYRKALAGGENPAQA
ncbi:NAD(P)H-dependent oxidoreductase [Streptomyces sp. NPDC096152]|uniref:NAD(P)H-dependent oxidoreductase n=1 Tax=Streptomyces sp. NPDC096152 TaxID=3366078 RepID=UPI0037F7481E